MSRIDSAEPISLACRHVRYNSLASFHRSKGMAYTVIMSQLDCDGPAVADTCENILNEKPKAPSLQKMRRLAAKGDDS